MKCCYCKSWSMCFDEKPYYNECKSVCPLEEKEAELDNVSQGLAKDLAKDGDAISRQAVDELSKELVHITRDKADFLCKFWEGLQKLPPVKPQEPSDISNDGTLTVNVEDGRKISRVLVCGANHWGGLYYPDEQEPKTGHWITQWNVAHQKEYYCCSECREEFSYDGETGIKMNDYGYCPRCGAKMEEQA